MWPYKLYTVMALLNQKYNLIIAMCLGAMWVNCGLCVGLWVNKCDHVATPYSTTVCRCLMYMIATAKVCIDHNM